MEIKFNDPRLEGLWSLIGSKVVFKKEDKQKRAYAFGRVTCEEIFNEDPIAYQLMSEIISKNANPKQIRVFQRHNPIFDGKVFQKIGDIQETLKEVENPVLIVNAGSKYAIILVDASYGIDVWVWDLRNSWIR